MENLREELKKYWTRGLTWSGNIPWLNTDIDKHSVTGCREFPVLVSLTSASIFITKPLEDWSAVQFDNGSRAFSHTLKAPEIKALGLELIKLSELLEPPK